MKLELTHRTCRATVDTLGGELISFRDMNGTEYIWGGDPAYWSGRNPILFPIVGSLKNGRIRFQGREFQMPRHGFARRLEFHLAEQGEDYAVFSLHESPETLAQYPFPFLLRVRHQLLDKGFYTQFEVENTGEQPLPFCIGAHTAFRCPIKDGERFQDYQLVFDQPETAGSIALTPEGILSHDRTVPALQNTDTIPLDYAPFDQLDTLVFDALASKGVRLVHRDSGHGVHMEFRDFPMIAFWTMPHMQAPYLCLEPWHGCAAYDNENGEFTGKPHCILLAPGDRRRLRYTVTLV